MTPLDLTDEPSEQLAPSYNSGEDASDSHPQTFPHLDPSDLASMVRWLTLAADAEENLGLPARQRRLLEGIAEMVDAGAWVWLAGFTSGDEDGEAVVTILDGGWASDQERLQFFRAIGQSAQDLLTGVFGPDVLWPKTAVTRSSEGVLDDPEWRPTEACRAWMDAGFQHILASVCTLDAQSYSGVMFHRRSNEPPFGGRERAIVHAMFQQVEWMHRSVAQAAALVSATDLSPREREVLVRVLAGESRKTIASTLHLSVYTVADHLKQIYRKLGVKTRAGLMAKFIQGQVKPPGGELQV